MTRSGWLSTTRTIVMDPLYRVFILVLLFQGFGGGGAVPFIALWASHVLHADAVQVGILRTVSGLIGVAFGLVLGTVSDRTGRRTPWILGGMVASTVGWAGVALASDFAVGTAMYTLAGLGSFTLVFALLGDWLRHRRAENATVVNSTVRLSFAVGWVGGPAAAGLVVGALGYPPLFIGTAVLSGIGLILAMRGMRDPPSTPTTAAAAATADVRRPSSTAPLWFFVTASFLSSAASPGRFVLLPLFITEELRAPVTLVGMLFTVSVIFELPLFPIVAHLADRYGIGRMLTAGYAAYAIYFAGLAVASDYWQLLVLEVFFAFMVATTNGVGILHVQNLAPARAGTAIGLYSAASQLGPVVTAPVLGYLATQAGWQGSFLTSSAIAAASVVAFLLSLRAGRRRGAR